MKLKIENGQLIEKLLESYGSGVNSKSITVVTFVEAKKIKSIFQIYKGGHIQMSTSSATEAEIKYNSIKIQKEEVSNGTKDIIHSVLAANGLGDSSQFTGL